MKAVAGSQAQFCAISGDLARLTGQPGDYETLRELLRPVLDKMPVGLSLGNHDHRTNFEKAFAAPHGTRQKVGRKHVLSFEWTDLRAVFLDSLLETNVTARFPGIQIAGVYAPPFRPLRDDERAQVTRSIIEARTDIVWVGLGMPKQEKWMAHMRDRLDVPVMCGVGAAFDFHAGRVPQAPRWMQERGLEWIYRIVQEPRRLLPRYLYFNPRFVVAFARQYLAERRNGLT